MNQKRPRQKAVGVCQNELVKEQHTMLRYNFNGGSACSDIDAVNVQRKTIRIIKKWGKKVPSQRTPQTKHNSLTQCKRCRREVHTQPCPACDSDCNYCKKKRPLCQSLPMKDSRGNKCCRWDSTRHFIGPWFCEYSTKLGSWILHCLDVQQ